MFKFLNGLVPIFPVVIVVTERLRLERDLNPVVLEPFNKINNTSLKHAQIKKKKTHLICEEPRRMHNETSD